jgi:hypothetical protein
MMHFETAPLQPSRADTQAEERGSFSPLGCVDFKKRLFLSVRESEGTLRKGSFADVPSSLCQSFSNSLLDK